MVAGSLSPPRHDLANEDLVRAHVHAIWLSEVRLSLGSSLTDVLDVMGDAPTLELLDHVNDDIERAAPRITAREHAARVLADIEPELQRTSWWSDEWLDQAMTTVANRFRAATARWCGLYRSALEQANLQTSIINNAGRSPSDRKEAKRLRREAEAQLERLRSETGRKQQSDFYSYRYFASEGFLPGYSFPRLPLSAFIPARRGSKGKDEFLQRPRFLAISEFGPRSIVYHEGSRYVINRVFLPVERGEDNKLPTTSVKQCSSCGYLHPVEDGEPGLDICENCGAPLDPPITKLFRLQNVATKRRDRINSDEEDRVRQGFDVHTGVRFAALDGLGRRVAHVVADGTTWGKLTYGGAATLWRINMGWKRRKDPNVLGFVLDTERGYWAQNVQAAVDDQGDAMSQLQERVVPYVEDRRNALLFEPAHPIPDLMASLAAALKSAIQITFDL